MQAKDYPVTLGYKATTPPYGTAAHPYHKGIDYGCPIGTEVVINGVVIGLSGATGFVDGAHLHVGRFVGGQDTNPIGGFSFQSAIVTEINEDAEDGKFVRVQADGASWVYLHLSNNNLVKVGQVLQGEEMTRPTAQQVIDAFQKHLGKDPRPEEIDYYDTHDVSELYAVLLNNRTDRVKELEKQLAQSQSGAKALAPGIYKVN